MLNFYENHFRRFVPFWISGIYSTYYSNSVLQPIVFNRVPCSGKSKTFYYFFFFNGNPFWNEILFLFFRAISLTSCFPPQQQSTQWVSQRYRPLSGLVFIYLFIHFWIPSVDWPSNHSSLSFVLEHHPFLVPLFLFFMAFFSFVLPHFKSTFSTVALMQLLYWMFTIGIGKKGVTVDYCKGFEGWERRWSLAVFCCFAHVDEPLLLPAFCPA